MSECRGKNSNNCWLDIIEVFRIWNSPINVTFTWHLISILLQETELTYSKSTGFHHKNTNYYRSFCLTLKSNVRFSFRQLDMMIKKMQYSLNTVLSSHKFWKQSSSIKVEILSNKTLITNLRIREWC